MDLFFPLLSSIFLIIVVVQANHAILEPQVYWRTILPHTPMPSAIEILLQPDVYDKPGTSVNVGKDGEYVTTDKGTSVNVGKDGVNVNTDKSNSVNVGPTDKPGRTTVNGGKGGFGVDVKTQNMLDAIHIIFIYKQPATDTQLHDYSVLTQIFLRQDLHRGKKFTLLLEGGGRAAAFIPRSEAESIPFSTSELPAILNRFSIPVGSAEAAAMGKTLSVCEVAPVGGEKKFCATSLESMVDFARTRLGTQDLVAVANEGGRADGEIREYKVGMVKRVGGRGNGAVVCHPMAYAYAVFLCHSTAMSEVYEVEMAAEGGGKAVKAVAICHIDTEGWSPEHLAFRVLKVKPGTVPVCHFLLRDNVVLAEKV